MPGHDSAPGGPGHTARKAFYRSFYALPAHWRRRIVRLFQPRYIVGAVAIVRTNDADPERLLLLRQPPDHGWSLPAGLLDRGEVPVQAVARELAEESGIELRPGDFTAAQPSAIIHTNGRWVDCVFEARVPADTAVSVDGAEVYEAAFHPIDALPRLSVPTARLLAHYDLGPYAKDPVERHD
jgi:ADP-ribose pyrophosphatase YjhB (NUDIX family)